MQDERIKVSVTETDQTIEVVVLRKRPDQIEVVIGEGQHSVKCTLTPSHNGMAFVGNVMGREVIYNRSPQQVQEDLDKLNPKLRKSRPK